MELHVLAALALSGLIGLSLGLLGGGGSILALPVLVYVAGVDTRIAVVMSLAIVGATSLAGSLTHWRAGRVNTPVALIFGAAGFCGAIPGSWLTHMVSGGVLLLLFAMLMLLVGALMLFRRQATEPDPGGHVRMHLPLPLAAGFGVGMLTGFLGVGGGFLIVPALVLLTNLPMGQAVGTSLLVIAINSASGLIGHLGQSHLPVALTLGFTCMAIAGALAGARAAGHMPQAMLRRGFALFVIAVGLWLLARNYNALY
ncbi:MAG: sulfite exporter TauE/SafE family protein [Blastocatellia bacterium]